jgi:adenosylcobinamide-phosphate synthase
MNLSAFSPLIDAHWAWALLLGVGLDVAFGEPRRWHPLVGFGRLAQRVEACLNREGGSRAAGVGAVLLLMAPLLLLLLTTRAWIDDAWRWVLDGVVLYAALGARSLHEHVARVQRALGDDDLAAARQAVQCIVTRDCSELDAQAVSGAAIESALENGSDAIFATLFWFVVAGAPGVLVHRLANTLDAMWGYKNERFLRFGWAAARLDDGLNWLPARLTAVSYAVLGYTKLALWCWRHQARLWESPNAGPVMASGAGSLGVRLGGPARYHGRIETRPVLGAGRAPEPRDVARALALVASTMLLWLVVLSLLHLGVTR